MSKAFPGAFKTAEYSLELPLSKTKVVYRGYNVSDERTLIAAASARTTDKPFYINNTLKIVQDAILNDVDARKLPAVDVRYLLLHQRSKSVGESLEFTFNDEKINLDIGQIYVQHNRTKNSYIIDIGDGYGIKMKELSFEDEVLSSVSVDEKNRTDIIYLMMLASIESIYDADNVWVVGTDITKEEAEKFILSIPSAQARPIYEFIASMPVLAADYMNEKGERKTLTNREVDFLSSASRTVVSSITTE